MRISTDVKSAILAMYATDTPTRCIAERFELGQSYIRKLASRHGVRKGSDGATVQSRRHQSQCNGKHIEAYKRARRGFHVPQPLEAIYIRMLAHGMSRNAAAVALGLYGMGP